MTEPNARPRWHGAALWALLLVGVGQMAGDLAGVRALKGLAAATGASPAPKVFSAVRGFETFTTRFFLDWTEADGEARTVELTSDLYARLRGPYNRRNVYGAALAYAPVLPPALRDPVLAYALGGEARLLGELGVARGPGAGPVTVRLEARDGTAISPEHPGRTFEATAP